MAVSSHGTLFRIGDGGTPEVFATIAEVMDIEAVGPTVETETFYGDGGGYPVVVPATMEPGEATFDINYTKAITQTTLRDALANQTQASFQLVFPTSPEEVCAFTGYVTGFEFTAPVEGVMRASVTITMASAMVFS